jgi:hypothetical protein
VERAPGSALIAVDELALVTVEQNMSLLSRRDKEGALAAAELARRLGGTGARQLANALSRGAIIGTSVTRRNITDYVGAAGVLSEAAVQGKTTRHNTRPNALVHSEAPISLEEQSMYGDVFYLDSLCFLFLLVLPMEYVHVVYLGSQRSVPNVCFHIIALVTMFVNGGYIMKAVFFDNLLDGPKPKLSIESAFRGLLLWICAAGQHVPEAERGVRTFKDRMRTAVALVPFKVFGIFTVYLAIHTALLSNLLPTHQHPNAPSPREQLMGTKLDVGNTLQAAFGDMAYVLAETGASEWHHKSMAPRTETAIMVGFKNASQGSMYFVSLKNNQVITRGAAKFVPTSWCRRYRVPPGRRSLKVQELGRTCRSCEEGRRSPCLLCGGKALALG